MNTQQNIQLEIDQANIELAIDRISEMAAKRGLVLTGVPNASIPEFPSKAQSKKFRRRMSRVIKHATMRTSNSFLSHLGKSRVDYCDKEKSIIEARKKYREALKATKELRTKYLEEKGDYYCSKKVEHRSLGIE